MQRPFQGMMEEAWCQSLLPTGIIYTVGLHFRRCQASIDARSIGGWGPKYLNGRHQIWDHSRIKSSFVKQVPVSANQMRCGENTGQNDPCMIPTLAYCIREAVLIDIHGSGKYPNVSSIRSSHRYLH